MPSRTSRMAKAQRGATPNPSNGSRRQENFPTRAEEKLQDKKRVAKSLENEQHSTSQTPKRRPKKVVEKPLTLIERLKNMGVTDTRKGAMRDQLIALGVSQVEIGKLPQNVDAYRSLLLKILKAKAKANT